MIDQLMVVMRYVKDMLKKIRELGFIGIKKINE
jgi:hypothetical protein